MMRSKVRQVKKQQESESDPSSFSEDDYTKPQNSSLAKKSHEKPKSTHRRIQIKTAKKYEQDEQKEIIALTKRLPAAKIQPNAKSIKILPKKQEQTQNYQNKKVKVLKKCQQDNSKLIQNSLKKQQHYERKNPKRQNPQDESERIASELLQQINTAYEDDVILYKKKQPAIQKLKLIGDFSKKLKEVEISKIFLRMGGILLFIKWLTPNEQTQQETSLTVKLHVLRLIYDLRINKTAIQEAQNLEKTLKKYIKSRFRQLRELSEAILKKWKNIKALKSQFK